MYDVSYSSWRTAISSYGAGADSSTVNNPLYSDVSTSSTTPLLIASNSPAINTGATTSYVTTDYRSISRPQGSAYDIGAYEYFSGSTDTTPPSGSITAPASGATISGSTVSLTASATDNVGVASVQFRVDGTNTGTADTTSPYSITWNSNVVSNGSHTISAVITDTSGNTYTTSGVTVTVSNVVS